MNKNITIIIPLYNKEKYIYKCLNSILLQSYEFYEVLIIDDGSTDNSAKICEEFYSKDKRFKYFSKENGGVSSARNLGIEKARYDYIVFVDADDYIEEDYLKSLTGYECDLVVEGFKKDENGFFSEFHIFNEECNKNQMLKYLMKKEIANIFSVPYLKLFKLEYIKNNNIRFNEKISFGEDFDFVLKYLRIISGTVKLVDECHYINRIEQESLSRKDLPDIWNQLLIVYNTIKESYDDEKSKSFYLIRFIKISLLNSYCKEFKNFKKIFYQIRNNEEFIKINFEDINKHSIDWIIYVFIRLNFRYISYLIFRLKRGK